MEIDAAGRIAALTDKAGAATAYFDILLPAPANVHSHSFQRAMAGLTEYRGDSAHDDFWSWRSLMYRFLEALTPEDIEAIAAQTQMEMLEAGYAAIGEFHYIHHQNGGASYSQPAELSLRLLAAAQHTGIGYTHLPVLYMRGGLDDRPLEAGQLRFGCDIDRFDALYENMSTAMADGPADYRLGVAPHSLRAVTHEGLNYAAALPGRRPIHIHIAEQTAEVDAVKNALGAGPVRWLLDHLPVDDRWSLIHATHMAADEIVDVARSEAVAGLCPITEANLGDGVFEAGAFIDAGGRFAVGSDSNVRISLSEELRLLEYSQRLSARRRCILADRTRSCGRFLYDHATTYGAQSIGREAGTIRKGAFADLLALDMDHIALAGLSGDRIVDAWLFAADDSAVSDVWAAGRHVVQKGRHIARDAIEQRFSTTISKLRSAL